MSRGKNIYPEARVRNSFERRKKKRTVNVMPDEITQPNAATVASTSKVQVIIKTGTTC